MYVIQIHEYVGGGAPLCMGMWTPKVNVMLSFSINHFSIWFCLVCLLFGGLLLFACLLCFEPGSLTEPGSHCFG